MENSAEYRFHTLRHPAPSLDAAHFLAQVAGAPVAELQQPDPEQESWERTFFPPGHRRSFLEILFLKLSFLHEVLLLALRRDMEPAGISIDRIWVTLSPLARILPLFWNFRVTIFEPVVPAAATPSSGDCCAPLGAIWFRALISSRNVKSTDLLHAVVDHLALSRGADGETLPGQLAEMLVPQNIYWEPEGRKVPAEWRTLWERACSLGLNLVCGSVEEVPGPLRALLSELKGMLLAAPAAPEIPPQPRPYDEAVLRSVVGKLIERYQALEAACPAPASGESAATMMMFPLRDDSAPAPPAAEDPLMETLLIPQGVKESLSPEAAWGDEQVMETVILSVDAAPRDFSVGKNSVPDPQQEGPDLLETVLLAPRQVRGKDPR